SATRPPPPGRCLAPPDALGAAASCFLSASLLARALLRRTVSAARYGVRGEHGRCAGGSEHGGAGRTLVWRRDGARPRRGLALRGALPGAGGPARPAAAVPMARRPRRDRVRLARQSDEHRGGRPGRVAP